ncbi:MAG: UDP-N-acetylglucosamine diphosphorylase [Candidatus Xiphinematobacter sp.]|nr:MAG: UDP-N-acetylglucosamine diphosphorylase [Candidatus Xiphinematobacter sp.]QQY08612.1 MAG: UDP-N-acetylglucosamine diphosphorylase [Candidatus Xiphinematobacter sp.]QQY09348.1 MAG: UDP-N-acetylglucosamine diphosphorylase [Candidatus Xiphinematobacter sp.]QQY10098.1 MAG: UDP-N-acetylglucosamine diphosphorylase [Candidatus Xiphinematobacter sp.]QQY10832.1 MAG: UDP-N-acetylglucosamine diphosphorylase [Candidatus Xiphinematobacter sp.]
MFRPEDYFDLAHTEHATIFEKVENVWEALSRIGTYLQLNLRSGVKGKLIGKPLIGKKTRVGKGTLIESGAVIKGPAWIGEHCQIRHGCYIRENVIVGNGVILGNSCELKNCLVFDGARLPHFNYVGDSILGYQAHLGAGVILSNVKLSSDEVWVTGPHGKIATGLRKFGAILGDCAKVGCHSILNPGSLIGPHAVLYPGCQWHGVLPACSIVKPRHLPLEILSGEESS